MINVSTYDELKIAPRRMRQMYAALGALSGARCRDCAHYVAKRVKGKTGEMICARRKQMDGGLNEDASNWRGDWIACGLFELRHEEIKVKSKGDKKP